MISLLQLQYFLAVAEEGHLTRTAEKLFISQSTLSSMISKLESELGVELFDRKNKRMVLNKFGKEYQKNVLVALNALEIGEENVKTLAASCGSHLSIALSNAQIWHEAIWNFKNKHTESHIQIYADKMEEYGELLASKELDFIMAGDDDLDTSQFEGITLTERKLCLCVPKGHPFSNRSSIRLKEIEDEPYIDLSPGLPFRRFCDRVFQKVNVSMNKVIECNYEMRPRLVKEGYGVSITVDGPRCRRMFAGNHFVIIEDEEAVRKVNLYWLKGRPFTPIMQSFYEYVLSSECER